VKKKVLVFSRASSAGVMADLRERYDLSVFLDPLGADREAFVAALADADGLIGAGSKLDESVLQHAPKLQVISTISAGYDNYDVAYLKQRGIRLTNTPDAVTETTADTGFMLLMMTARRAVELATLVREGEWKASIGEAHSASACRSSTAATATSRSTRRSSARGGCRWTRCSARPTSSASACRSRRRPIT